MQLSARLFCLVHLLSELSETKDHSRRRKSPVPTNDQLQNVETPVLSGLVPNSGPRDGGTNVVLRGFGLNESLWNFTANLVSILQKGNIQTRPIKILSVEHTADGLVFEMPDLRHEHKLGSGVLVSVNFWQLGHKVAKTMHSNPLFFRLLDESASLAPAWINPCCEYSISGGQTVLLAGSKHIAPDHHALVRFTGQDDEQTVDAQAMPGDWGLNLLSKDAPKDVWYVYVVTPPWPHAEDDIKIEISWNTQQFARFRSTVSFVEDQSFFGDVAGHISEEHLAHTDSHHGEHVRKELISVLENEQGDTSSVMLLNHAGDAFILARSNDLTHLQEDIRIVHDIFTLTIAAMLGGLIATRIGMPTIIGFLLSGIVVGPGCGDMIVELVQVESIAELGVCLLLFCLGLELTWEELFANSYAALAGLLSMVILCGIIILVAALFLQTSMEEAACIGLFAALSSTPVSLKAMPAMSGTAKVSQNGGALMAILITQDIVLAGMLAIMPIVFSRHRKPVHDGVTGAWNGASHAELSMGFMESARERVLLCLGLPLSVGFVFIYRRRYSLIQSFRQHLISWIVHMDKDLLAVAAVGYVFAFARLFEFLGLSLELGAFLAGLALTTLQAEIAKDIEHQLHSLRDTFVAWFFASIGLVVNPHFLYDNLRAILSVTMFLFVLKLVTGFLPLWLLAHRWRRASPKTLIEDSLHMSWILAHISEFGFVLASKGTSWKVISRHSYLLLVGTNVVSLCLAPGLFHFWESLLQASHLVSPPATPVSTQLQKVDCVIPDVVGVESHWNDD